MAISKRSLTNQSLLRCKLVGVIGPMDAAALPGGPPLFFAGSDADPIPHMICFGSDRFWIRWIRNRSDQKQMLCRIGSVSDPAKSETDRPKQTSETV